MSLLETYAKPTVRHLRPVLGLCALATLIALLAGACGGGAGQEPAPTLPSSGGASDGAGPDDAITVYASPT